MATTNKIFIGIDDQVIELTGQAKADFIADREATLEAKRLLEAEYNAKKQARIDAITKLGEASGLTPAEIESILNI
jgi:pyrroloquinoline quinone (PQQ) biosynthesis protein C